MFEIVILKKVAKCHKCETEMKILDEVYGDRSTGEIYCLACGKPEATEEVPIPIPQDAKDLAEIVSDIKLISAMVANMGESIGAINSTLHAMENAIGDLRYDISHPPNKPKAKK